MTYSSHRTAADHALITAENARASRMARLDDALADVLYEDAEMIDGADREVLARARQIVQEIRP